MTRKTAKEPRLVSKTLMELGSYDEWPLESFIQGFANLRDSLSARLRKAAVVKLTVEGGDTHSLPVASLTVSWERMERPNEVAKRLKKSAAETQKRRWAAQSERQRRERAMLRRQP